MSENKFDEVKVLKNDKYEKFTPSSDHVLGRIRIVELLSNVEEFRKWVWERHQISSDTKLIEGYRFLIEVGIRTLIDALAYDPFLGINEDFTFYRARHIGLNLRETPNTCDKTILIKNIWKHAKTIKKSKKWNELEKNTNEFRKKVLNVLKQSLEGNTSISAKLLNVEINEIVNALGILYTNIYLADIRHNGEPVGYYFQMLDSSVTPKYLKRTFEGYKYGLQFLLQKLTGEKFKKTIIKDIHRVEELDLGKPSEGELDPVAKKWMSLHRLSSKLREEVVKPIQKEIGIEITSKSLIIDDVEKLDFHALLKEHPPDPDYLSDNSDSSVKKKVDRLLYWHSTIDVLDTRKVEVFSGVLAFSSVLAGQAEILRRTNRQEPVKILRFIHPNPEGGNDYSYGILIEAYTLSGLADYSGWLIFYDCCGDYSGFAESEHAFAEAFVKSYKEKGAIEVEEFKIAKPLFRDILAEKITTDIKSELIKELDDKTKIQSLQSQLGETKGMLLELLAYSELIHKNPSKIEWRYTFNGEEIDVIAKMIEKSQEKLYFVECSTSTHDKELQDRVARWIKNPEFKKDWAISEPPDVKLIRFFGKEPPPQVKKRLAEKGIQVWTLKNFLQESEILKHVKSGKINFIFDLS
ncbi:hypothetical protein AKJ45_01945 [candidate division MSBL1 archaeon SCGC-AAA261F19]|uniref:Uncharacterized protein n=1 Tax=candidate division MSBL1 archaeon SCGC-AAA261F19 TaxID=1698275 RepID=A0A133VA04_9EURY|nr:hypothetical protein AKJ45_01945 [candidate division MSBL1 archaeon SCGC-AAA261F19]